MKKNIQSLSKYLLALLVMAGAWGCASTTGLQNASYDDDDVYFSRKDREQAKIAKETAVKNTPTVTKTTTTVNNNNSNGNGLEVNPTYGVNKNDQTDVNPEYIENYRNGNGNSTITQNGITYSGNEYYTETRANNSRVQVPRDNFDTWGNTNNGVFYDPNLDPGSPFFNPYASTSNLRFGSTWGWGNNWRYRRWANRYRWYNPYYRNDYWFYRNVWWYGGYSRNNAWCPGPSRANTIYTGTTRIETRPRIINRNPRRSGSGRRGSTIITNNSRTNTKRRAARAITNGTDVNKRSATAGRRYKRTTNNSGKRVKTNSSGRQVNRSNTTTRPRRTRVQTRTRSRRNNSYSRPRSRSRSFNNRSNTRSRSTYKRSTSRPSYSKPRTRTRTVNRSTKSSSPKRSGGSRRKK
ncbi:hypothetical protein BKI52_14265 [marine bacterium AO1-C]|nr:hypothetical protein BKI52_14265 [marine bacterium AO1-C]